MFTKEQAINVLRENKQEHVMKYFDELTAENQKELLNQIENINWSDFKLIGGGDSAKRGEFSVPPAVEISEIEKRHDEFEAVGLEALKKGEVAAVLLAGGMGTRLGFDLPKGCFNVGETRELYIFQCLINNLMDVVKQAGCFIPLYIMTSEKNDQTTRSFLRSMIILDTTQSMFSTSFRIWHVLLITMASFFLRKRDVLQHLLMETVAGMHLW